MTIRPEALKDNARIGIVAPSYWMDESQIRKACVPFTEAGFSLVHGFSTLLRYNAYAGTPEERAEDINRFFADKTIDAVFCLRGGYGANRLLPLMDFDLIRQTPKIFIGYSDVTALLTSISQKTELVTFHGPMISSFKDSIDTYSINLMLDVLSGQSMQVPLPPDNKAKILKEGKAEGRLWGGNLTLLINRLGTEDALLPEDGILFLEETAEFKYAFDRLLYHLRASGTVEKIRGLIIGELTDFKDESIPFSRSTDEIILDNFGDLDIPIVSGFPCGHGKQLATLPVSLPVGLNAGGSSIQLNFLEKPVI